MPEPEKIETPEQESERAKCAHEALDYLNRMGVYINANAEIRRMLLHCPLYAIPGSIYCCPHTMLNGAETPEIKEFMNEYRISSLHYHSEGYHWCRPAPFAGLTHPGWWPHRFN